MAVSLRLSAEGADKNAYRSVFPWKGFDCILSMLLPKGLLLI